MRHVQRQIAVEPFRGPQDHQISDVTAPVVRRELENVGPMFAIADVLFGLGFITRPFTLVSLVVLLAVAIGLAVFWRGRIRGRRAKPA